MYPVKYKSIYPQALASIKERLNLNINEDLLKQMVDNSYSDFRKALTYPGWHKYNMPGLGEFFVVNGRLQDRRAKAIRVQAAMKQQEVKDSIAKDLVIYDELEKQIKDIASRNYNNVKEWELLLKSGKPEEKS